eukprot:scaffold2749_cov128-Skeletonema_marinoi.AAC.4
MKAKAKEMPWSFMHHSHSLHLHRHLHRCRYVSVTLDEQAIIESVSVSLTELQPTHHYAQPEPEPVFRLRLGLSRVKESKLTISEPVTSDMRQFIFALLHSAKSKINSNPSLCLCRIIPTKQIQHNHAISKPPLRTIALHSNLRNRISPCQNRVMLRLSPKPDANSKIISERWRG